MLQLQITLQLLAWRAKDELRTRAEELDWGADDGMTTETVIITAILAGLALAVGAIIVLKVTNKANSIPTDGAAGG